MMAVWGVIPARYGSTRFPGKPLVKIQGRELIAWVVAKTKSARLVDHVLVATDDIRIAEVARREGAEAVMTDSKLPSGTDRIWAALQSKTKGKGKGKDKEEAIHANDVILNIQGDEPLISGILIDTLIHPMLQDLQLEMATLAHELSLEELHSEHAVKVVVNARSEALYFSRFAIPYSRQTPNLPMQGALKHMGMYAFRSSFLAQFCSTTPAVLELAESLEQLRALYLGARIKVILSEQRSWGVDTPQDVTKIEEILKKEGGGW